MVSFKMFSIYFVSALAFAQAEVFVSDTPAVQTTSGILQGRNARTAYGVARQYLSVPYGEKPVRFSVPEPLETPDVVRDVTKLGPACVQPIHLKETMSPLLDTNQTSTSEDCLNLNVYVPVESESSKLPVVVWFPGEGFDYAIAQQFDGSYLATIGKVIVVTINYRVGVFGFLSTLSNEAPGNAGLWDQRLALQWVHQNIEAFNGDQNKITLMGRFTGSMSITAQMTSPINRNSGLFKRVILQSGIATGSWIFETNPRQVALKLAEAVGCGSNPELMMDCLRKAPSDDLLNKAMGMSWRPVLDGQFLTEDPMESFREGRVASVDVTLGVNSDEGSLCLLSLYYTNSTYYNKIVQNTLDKEDYRNLLNGAVEDFTKMKQKTPLQQLANHEYGQKVNESLRDSYVQFCGAMYITSQMEQAARFLSKRKGRVFMYEFDHRPSFSIHPQFIRAAHGDDMLFSLGLVHKGLNIPAEELQLSRNLIESFSSFSNFGQPSFKDSHNQKQIIWPQYKEEDHKVIHFNTKVNIRPSGHDREVNFWHSVVPSVASIIVSNDQVDRSVEVVALTNRTAGYIVGTLISVQTTEYVLLSLICLTMLLVISVAVVPYLLNRRTRKEGMLMEG